MSNPVFITQQELARRWGLCRRTIQRMKREGALPWVDLAIGGRSIPRFRLSDVEAYERSMEQGRAGREGTLND